MFRWVDLCHRNGMQSQKLTLFEHDRQEIFMYSQISWTPSLFQHLWLYHDVQCEGFTCYHCHYDDCNFKAMAKKLMGRHISRVHLRVVPKELKVPNYTFVCNRISKASRTRFFCSASIAPSCSPIGRLSTTTAWPFTTRSLKPARSTTNTSSTRTSTTTNVNSVA